MSSGMDDRAVGGEDLGMKRIHVRLLRSTILLLGLLTLLVAPTMGDYLPIWRTLEAFDYSIDCRNLGLRTFPYNDTSRVMTYEVLIREILRQPDAPEAAQVAAGDTVLVLARGNWLKDDRETYLLFVLSEHRRGYTGLPYPIFEGRAFPCSRFQPMFTREPVDCPTARTIGADFCACARETILRYKELLTAREEGREVPFLRSSLSDPNTMIVLSAMGLLRSLKVDEAMEWMGFLRDHPEYQVRYDLAASIPYIASEAAGQMGIWLLDDSEQKIQILAAFGLGRMRYEPASPRLAEVLSDTGRDNMVRASCLTALERIGSPLLLSTLEKIADVEPDTTLARGLRLHLERLRGKAAEPK